MRHARAGRGPAFFAVFCELRGGVIGPDAGRLMRTTLTDTRARLGPIAPTRQKGR
ncbi:hypothetical protein AB4305_03330 [Nocardia sp. 2YAB30]|uniref:hypothetical protein n=1 Tax=unclassified Nocardia TaxID=2637762 RepID=UPI003F9CC16E